MFKRQKIIEGVWIVVVVLLFVISIQMTRNGSLANQINSSGILAPVIFVLLKMSTIVIAPLGGTPLYFLAGSLFGSLNGFILSIFADALASAICFFLSKFYGERVVKRFVGEKFFEKITSTVSVLKDSRSFIKARVAAFAMPEILAYASGFSKINFWTFFLINTLFYAAVDFILVFFGSEIIVIAASHAVWFYSVIAVITVVGFWFLYRDYKKLDNVQGM